MSEIVKHYENRQGGYTDVYVMKFCRESSGIFTVWCVRHPADPHGKGATHHHLFDSGKLCQRQGYESRSLEHAEAFAYWWMKRWSIYVRTGVFPMTPQSVRVPD